MKYRWVPRPVDNPEALVRAAAELPLMKEALRRVMVLRGIETRAEAVRFVMPSIEHLHDPFAMRDMDVAADRVARAIEQRERVLVYGDYDVDGTTATALMTSFLRARGVEAEYFIPDRFEDGYGLGRTGIDRARALGAGLIIALDCGITAVDEAAYTRSLGLDLIICDHHKPDAVIPDALAVLNPKRPGCAYPFKELSGCGVGFKLVQAVMARRGELPEKALEYLDLVAISTASDIVPMVGENRILVAAGLQRLQQYPRLGVAKLAALAGMRLSECSTHRIVFGIGPRINAAGRMGDASRAVALLLETDDARAAEQADALEQANRQRRDLDQETLEQAVALADRQLTARTRHSVVLYQPGWHLGVIGIVASRLVDRYYRPTIMLSSNNGEAKGSARSISGINVYDALRACEDLLTSFGGHDYAAGLSLPAARVPEFQERFDAAVAAQLTPDLLIPAIAVDAPVALSDIDDQFLKTIRMLAPHGPDNDLPVFHARGVMVTDEPRTMGSTRDHIKFFVRDGQSGGGPVREVVGFKMSDYLPLVRESRATGRPLELLFSLEENIWNGTTRWQLRARDLRLEDDSAVG